MKCEKCDNESTITVQSSGHFCKDCFIDYFRQKFRRILGASKLIRNGNLVGIPNTVRTYFSSKIHILCKQVSFNHEIFLNERV